MNFTLLKFELILIDFLMIFYRVFIEFLNVKILIMVLNEFLKNFLIMILRDFDNDFEVFLMMILKLFCEKFEVIL